MISFIRQSYFSGFALAAVGFVAFASVPAAHGIVATVVLAAFFCARQLGGVWGGSGGIGVLVLYSRWRAFTFALRDDGDPSVS